MNGIGEDGMFKDESRVVGVLVFLIVGVMLGSIIAGTSITNDWRLDSAKTECAQFNPTNGHFEWLSE